MKKFLVLLLFVGLVAGASASMTKGPYLIYPGTNTQMTVLWQLSSSQGCTLEWGTSASYGSSTTTSTYGDNQHKHTITSLTPGTKYFYRVNDGSTYTGTFYAAPSESADSVKFLGFGDNRTNTATMNSVLGGMISAYGSDSELQTFTMLSGDWVNNGLDDDEWQAQFFNRSYSNILELQANLPINGVIGNHETLSATGNDGDMFLKYFPYPYTSEHYWSFDYGPVHIAVVDQYDGGYGTISGTQLSWLDSDMSATNKTWKIMQFHAPGYSGDGQGAHTDTQQVRDEVQPICQDYGVDLVFNGHNHYYVRCYKNGVYHITAGNAGASLDTPDPDYTPYVQTTAKSYGYCQFDVDGSAGEMYVTAKDPSNGTLDSFTCDKSVYGDLPWSDGFESGDFATGGWVRSNTRDSSIGTDPYAGTYSAELTKGAWISKELSTKGFSDIHVKYAAKVAGDPMDVEWSPDGSTWYSLETVTSSTWATSDKTCPAGADNIWSFQIRFDNTGGPGDTAFIDSVEVTGSVSEDTTAPSPDPMTWAGVPDGSGESTVDMTATSATDSSGVEYFFDCLTAGGHDSSWQMGTYYEDSGLSAATSYTYQVKARDKSPAQNETAFSTTQAGMTDAADSTAPNPDPAEWATVPYATGDASISMTATTASDVSGVEYFFDCITAGGHDSVWQAGSSYEDSSLSPSTSYTYQTKSRDQSAAQNETVVSTTASATTDASDTTAPSPDPASWSTVPYSTGSSSINMIATTATDASGVEYLFDCTAGGGNNSAWQADSAYEDTGLSSSSQYTYQTKSRDTSSNYNETGVSTTASATTDSAGVLPFSDYFPVYGDFGTGGWTTSGYKCAVNSQCMCEGTNGAQIKGTGAIEKAISTEGYTDIHVEYLRKAYGADTGEYLTVEYHDGTQWNLLEQFAGSSCSYTDQTCGSSANNNASFKIRFSANFSKTNEYACFDAVIISGTE